MTGEPLMLTLVLTNTDTQPYRDELPVSIFDLEATGVLTTTPYTWRWSDTRPVTDQLRTIDLDPNESLRLQWDWTVDPGFRTVPPPKHLAVSPVFRYRDDYKDGQITTSGNGSYLSIPIDYTPGYPCVPIP